MTSEPRSVCHGIPASVTSLGRKDPVVALNLAIFLMKRGEGKLAREWLSQYEARLPGVRDPKTGLLRLEAKVNSRFLPDHYRAADRGMGPLQVTEMAEKVRAVMEGPAAMPGTAVTVSGISTGEQEAPPPRDPEPPPANEPNQ